MWTTPGVTGQTYVGNGKSPSRVEMGTKPVNGVCEALDVLIKRLEPKLDDLVPARTDKHVAGSALVVDWSDVVRGEGRAGERGTSFGGALEGGACAVPAEPSL